jgi:MYXO-CTERM domain-containing protein
MPLAKSLLVPMLLCTGVAVADAHITLLSPAPRTDAQKIGPCGADGSTRGPALTYQPGETITVEWDESVDHPGHYRIAFNMDGQEFEIPGLPTDDFPETLVNQIADKEGGLYSQDITFPDAECDNCTLQLIQVMTTNVPYNSFYFQCADIVLSNAAPGGPDAGDDGMGGGGDGGGGTTGPATGGCTASGDDTGGFGWLLLGLLLFVRRSKRTR